jgi:membrane-associated phospholipid phosphatase
MAGAVLLIATLLAGAAFHRFPGPTALDRLGFSLLPHVKHSVVLTRVTDLGNLPVLIIGTATAALVAFWWDRRRALACLLGPPLAAVLADWALKPLVGRLYLEVLTFPSGSVTAIAAVSTAWVLAVPGWPRWVVGALGVGAVAAVSVAVVALRWHYPTDAAAGAAFGIGVVLLIDGVLHSSTLRRSHFL